MINPNSKPTWEQLLSSETLASLQEVGRLITQARKLRKMSRSELALRIGVDRRTLTSLEEGRPGVSWGVFFQVLSTLNLLRGIEEVVRPENDLQALSQSIRSARQSHKRHKKIEDKKVNF